MINTILKSILWLQGVGNLFHFIHFSEIQLFIIVLNLKVNINYFEKNFVCYTSHKSFLSYV